jgi:hypothetical protein
LVVAADGVGAAVLPLAVPANAALEGQSFDFQLLNVVAGGALFGAFDASNGLRIRVGNAIPGCP